MTKLTRIQVATAIATAIGGRAWASDVLPNGGRHVRVYPPRGGFIAVLSQDGEKFTLRYDGGYNDGAATRVIKAGIVAESDCTVIREDWLATLRTQTAAQD